MNNFQFIFIRLSLYLIAGMVLAFYIEVGLQEVIISGFILIIFYLISLYRASRQIFSGSLVGIMTFLLIFYLGFASAFFSQPKNDPKHYINQNLGETDSILISGRITEELKPSAFSNNYIFEAQSLVLPNSRKAVSGKILLNLLQDSLATVKIIPGAELLIPYRPQEIKKAVNPYQFSYRDYMKNLQVESKIALSYSQLVITGHQADLRSLSWAFREQLISNLEKLKFEKDELAVFQALILGQRREISDQLYKNYAAAGAIHILAISGLHIGILLLLLNYILKPLERFKYGHVLKPFTVILLLWSFAFLTGLSPSVVRAVSMFSFLAIGLQTKRKTSSLNSLFISLFFLTLINPYYLFQVGFQLSYLAVFSIIILQPYIYKIFSPRISVIDYFWKLTSVSLAAQIGVLPLSIFYFHQFPGLFLATNLVILPFLGTLLVLGIGVIILASFDILPNLIYQLFSGILELLNGFVNLIAEVDTFVISGIRLDILQMGALYLFLFSVILNLKKINFYRISFTLITVLLFQTATLIQASKIPQYESVVFHQNRHSVLTIKNNDHLDVTSDSIPTNDLITDYLREREIKNIHYKKFSKVMDLSGSIALVIDTAGVYTVPDFDPEIVILRNSAKVNLDRVLSLISPAIIIADGSNYKTYIGKWELTARNKKIPFHYTGEKGAYVIK
ncbi:ComEC/Rec2 family competence protein [Christiangramia sabulilitoris]|uniref:ComEC family competence protein n=1 Tax=Christiangramia sabulilitoris TaxID=2583991 RepID=A0A550I8D0_9FLAO|nr:ComEC/Rec2 family competence protein [Christiangramia sabulilitoris]TRO67078.1 ComEC family competence protein [Christiangramia sabulilitoris]